MDADNLIRMANRIGDFFEAMPDRAEALDGIATHIRRFWEPRMRREFIAIVDAGAPGVKDVVLEAVRAHRDRLTPPAPGC